MLLLGYPLIATGVYKINSSENLAFSLLAAFVMYIGKGIIREID